MKKCTKCGIEKPLSEFYKDKNKKSGIKSHCRMCCRSYLTPEKRKEYNKKYQLKSLYGLTLEKYNEIKKQQKNKCAICCMFLNNDFFTHVDHDHNTGTIRGILCHSCNIGLGNFKDSQFNLKSALRYLKKYSVNPVKK